MKIKYNIEDGTDAQQVIQLLEDKLYAYNATRTGKDDGNLFSKVIKNESNDVVAGIAGWTWAGICEITQLWIDENTRGNGTGKMLLETAEEEAKTKGCTIIMVRSYSFQAPFFYEKNGYRVEHVINNFPKGYNYYILIKRIE